MMRGQMKSLTKNKAKLRAKRFGEVELRTEDRHVDLDADWKYRKQMFEICQYMGVQIVWLRSDSFRCYAHTISVTVNPPTTEARLMTIAHEAAHVGFRHIKLRMPRHRMEYETGGFEAQFVRHCGIEPTIEQVNSGKCYVGRLIHMAIRRGITKFDQEAWEYAMSGTLPNLVETTLNSVEPILIDKSRDNGFREAMAHFF